MIAAESGVEYSILQSAGACKNSSPSLTRLNNPSCTNSCSTSLTKMPNILIKQSSLYTCVIEYGDISQKMV
jgi:hypothetical protein